MNKYDKLEIYKWVTVKNDDNNQKTERHEKIIISKEKYNKYDEIMKKLKQYTK
jgi:lysyl-tRNA synthetase class II